MKLKSFLPLLLAIFAIHLFTGCDNDLGDLVFDRDGDVIHVSDQQGNELELTEQMAAEFKDQPDAFLAYFRARFPETYAQPNAPAPQLTVDTTIGPSTPNQETRAVVDTLKTVPIPGVDVVGYALSGVLGIWGLWRDRQAKTAQKRESVAQAVNASLVKGVDTFRDILDQTEGGAAIDAHLTQALKSEKARLSTEAVTTIAELLQRFTTADKPRGGIQLPATTQKTV